MEIVSVIFVTAVFLSNREVRGDDTISRCTANELSQFSVEYETCHQRALQKIKVDNQIIKPIVTNNNKDICEALSKLIDDCTIILGWCFSTEQVVQVKKKQRAISLTALATMNIHCPEDLNLDIPEDKFAENEAVFNDSSNHIQLLPRPSSSINSGGSKVLSYVSLSFILAIMISHFIE